MGWRFLAIEIILQLVHLQPKIDPRAGSEKEWCFYNTERKHHSLTSFKFLDRRELGVKVLHLKTQFSIGRIFYRWKTYRELDFSPGCTQRGLEGAARGEFGKKVIQNYPNWHIEVLHKLMARDRADRGDRGVPGNRIPILQFQGAMWIKTILLFLPGILSNFP